jgi:hypothetical protein
MLLVRSKYSKDSPKCLESLGGPTRCRNRTSFWYHKLTYSLHCRRRQDKWVLLLHRRWRLLRCRRGRCPDNQYLTSLLHDVFRAEMSGLQGSRRRRPRAQSKVNNQLLSLSLSQSLLSIVDEALYSSLGGGQGSRALLARAKTLKHRESTTRYLFGK